LNEVSPLLVAQVCPEETVVVLDNVAQRGEASIVIEAALLMCPESLQRSGSVTFIGRPLGLKVVDSNLRWSVHVPARLRVDWRHVTDGTLRYPFEQRLSACRRRRVI